MNHTLNASHETDHAETIVDRQCCHNQEEYWRYSNIKLAILPKSKVYFDTRLTSPSADLQRQTPGGVAQPRMLVLKSLVKKKKETWNKTPGRRRKDSNPGN